jgi:geranylgeranyl pyrophosphate synthase
LVYEAFGGKNSKALDLSIIPEVIHDGTIVHDDIEDNSEHRRGKPCTHKLFGLDISINIGDLMYFLPLITLIKNKDKFDEKTILKAYEVYATEMIRVAFGQGTELAWHNGLGNADNITEDEYLQMCYNKTGALSRMSAKLAAVLAGASDEQIEKAGKFAGTIGVAFQIQDDVLNLTGKAETFTGKDIKEDITEGKRSLPVVYTIQTAREEDKKRLTQILKIHTKNPELIEEAVEIIKKHDAIEHSKKVAKQIIEKAWKEFDNVLPESEAKKKLFAFAKFLVEREV